MTTFDGFDSPVGWNGNQAGSEVWPENYVDVNPIGTQYEMGYHTGADLNDNKTHGWDSDKFAPVFAVGNGVVSHAGPLPRTWGNVVVIDHDWCMSRYAHLHEFDVKNGDTVQRGQKIGLIGDAGRQLPFHLHFDMSMSRILHDKPEHWPRFNLLELVRNYVDPQVLIQLNRPLSHALPAALKAHANRNVNFRCGPSIKYQIYRTLLSGEPVETLYEFSDWKLVRLPKGEFGWCFGKFISAGEPEANGIVLSGGVRTAVGIHASADGGQGIGWKMPVSDEISALKPEVVKFQSSHSPEVVSAITSENKQTIRAYIIRAFLDWGGRPITADQFVDFTISDTIRTVNQIRAQGVTDDKIIVELHNEPNLNFEGLDLSWRNGRECVAFFATVLDRYKAQIPDVQYGLGALSPGHGVANIRRDSRVFLDEMLQHPRWKDFNVHLVHLYTLGDWKNDIWWLDHCQAKTPGMKVWITESSWHTDDGQSGASYAAKLVELLNLLDQRQTDGITFYCVSASNPAFFHEAWCRSSDKAQPAQNILSRGIAREIRSLRPLV